ncbi:cation diffusion facilitator family transporter [Methanosarcina sp. MSH10X1]|uniref:cation diffusion facilitator family transporter n=1 Tax=Methanosarcina sp. MSH10X1 TaxID=2507075 RepID=UPI000FFC3E0A|nr:cation diffusion facilitator family transporter [Methanosarcina sp. MSH10X1]RXA20861.1 cation diffusion facilitator family transporter [Methanosarcina sp. MSH10X1]
MIVQENLKLGVKASRNATLALAFLAFLKGAVGIYSGSTVLLADAVHTGLDIFASLAVWVGLKISLKSGGKHFPYGYYKAENIVALFVSLLILFSGFELLKEGFTGVDTTSEFEFQGLALATAVFSVLMIYGLSIYKRNAGIRINSQALITDARHSYTDVFSSLVVVVAVLGSMLGFSKLDSLGVIVISLLIFKMGIESARDAVLTLMDAWLDEEESERIRKNIYNIPGLIELEDLKLRKSGLVVFGEATVEVEGETDLQRVELLSEDIKTAVKKEVENLEHIVVNVKPVRRKNLKLALPVLERGGFQAKLSEHIGKAPYFLLIELEEGRAGDWKILENLFSNSEKKRGVKAVDLVIREKANAIAVKTVAEGPFYMLRDNFIKILRIPEGAATVRDVLDRFQDLEEITAPME